MPGESGPDPACVVVPLALRALRGTVAERLLQIVGQEQEDPEQPGRDEQHRQVGAAPVAVLLEVDSDMRFTDSFLS